MTGPDHLETCRAMNCKGLFPRSAMVPAKKVTGNLRARGFYCRDDAARRGWREKERQ